MGSGLQAVNLKRLAAFDYRQVIGGKEKRIPGDKWTSDRITVDLSSSDPTSGVVEVRVGKHRSNAAMLTEWHGVLRHTYRSGALQHLLTFDIRFRADIRKYRPEIHKEPVEPLAGVVAMAGSSLSYEVNGSFVCSNSPLLKVTSSWKAFGGPLFLKRGLAGFISSRFTVSGGFFDSRNLSLKLDLRNNQEKPIDVTILTETPESSVTGTFTMSLMQPHITLITRGLPLSLDEQANILANSWSRPAPASDIVGPCLQNAQVRVNWGNFSTNNRPDANSPR
jgi:hypothetical protein